MDEKESTHAMEMRQIISPITPLEPLNNDADAHHNDNFSDGHEMDDDSRYDTYRGYDVDDRHDPMEQSTNQNDGFSPVDSTRSARWPFSYGPRQGNEKRILRRMTNLRQEYRSRRIVRK
jgi:hypothetical protein